MGTESFLLVCYWPLASTIKKKTQTWIKLHAAKHQSRREQQWLPCIARRNAPSVTQTQRWASNVVGS